MTDLAVERETQARDPQEMTAPAGEREPTRPAAPVPSNPSEELAPVVSGVEEAARAWDIRGDLPEGRFVSALMAAIAGIGRVMDGSRAEFARLFDQQREAAKDELARAREITKAANTALSQARSAQISYVVEQENVVIRMIDKTLPMFIERMQGVLVLREKRLNADIQRRRYAAVGAVTLGLFLGGYALRSWQDADATSLVPQCLAHPYQAGSHIYCDVTRLVAPAP